MLTEHRRALHRIPETDRALPETAAYLRAALAPLPCRVFSPWADAVCAFFDFGRGDTVAFRSDMDALPITEQTDSAFASCHAGRMHACGHDGHMAILLALAEHLATHPASSDVLLIFQPAEETTGGAEPICAIGLLEQYHVSRIYGLHLWPDLPKHTVASRAGGMMARSCELTAQIVGKSVHIARYQTGADALFAAARLVCGAEALVREQPCLLRFGRAESGQARNSVSGFSRLEGSFRCFDDALFERLWQELLVLARQIGEETGCTLHLTRSAGYPPVCNDAALLRQAQSRFAVREVEPTYITEDFSYYQKRVPGVFFLLGTGGEALHSPRFDFDESVLETGLNLFRALL